MVNSLWRHLVRIVAATVAIPALSSATLLTAPPAGGTTTTFDVGSSCHFGVGSGLDAGFQFQTTGDYCGPYSATFGLADNGQWTGFELIGDNSGSTSITLHLNELASSIGGLINYAVYPGSGGAVIAAIAQDGNTVLESYNLPVEAPIRTPNQINAGEFRGIGRPSADIAYFRISGSYIVDHDLTIDSVTDSPRVTAVVSEPYSSVLVAGPILFLIGYLRGRSKRNRQTGAEVKTGWLLSRANSPS